MKNLKNETNKTLTTEHKNNNQTAIKKQVNQSSKAEPEKENLQPNEELNKNKQPKKEFKENHQSTTEPQNMETLQNSTKNKLSKKENFFQILKFVGFSISAGVIQIASFTLLNELIKWSYWPSYLISLTLSVLWNFTLNREFTFKSANNVPIAMLQVALYYVVFTPLSTWWGEALTSVGWNEYLVLFFTMVINMSTEFLFCRFVVYRKSINTNKRANKHENKK